MTPKVFIDDCPAYVEDMVTTGVVVGFDTSIFPGIPVTLVTVPPPLLH